MAKSCGGCGEEECSSRQQPQQPQQSRQISPEQLKAMQEQMREQQKIQRAFMKDAKPLGEKQVAILKKMVTCPNCKEYECKFVPCEKHFSALEETVKEVQRLQFYYKLKSDIHRALKK